MKIFMTGGTGFVGTNLTKQLTELTRSIEKFKRSRDPQDLDLTSFGADGFTLEEATQHKGALEKLIAHPDNPNKQWLQYVRC